MSRYLHVTGKIVTFVDPVLNEPYADVVMRVGGTYRDPVRNAVRKMPKKQLVNGKKRKVRSRVWAQLRALRTLKELTT